MHRAGGPNEAEVTTTRTGARLLRVRWPVAAVALAAVLLVPVGGATAAPTFINFDDVSTGFLTTQYPGVSFDNTEVRQRFGLFARSGSQFAETCSDVDSCSTNDPIRMDFSEGKHRVRAFVGLNRTSTTALTVQLRVWSRGFPALDRPPRVLGTAEHTFPASGSVTPIRQELAVTLTTNSIVAADFQVLETRNGGLAVDDLEFERGQARFSFSPDPVDFGEADVATGSVARTVTVTNTGQVGASPSDVFVDGADSGDFVVVDQTCTGRIVWPGDQCQVDLQFDPSASGTRTARLVVQRSGADPPESVRLLGAGTVPTTTTAASGVTTTAGPGEATITTGGSGTTLPDVPTATTIVIPPTTPGATLSVSPPIGVPGFVTVARGSGFSPGPAELSWLPGQGLTQVEVGTDGSFVVQVLIMPNDRLGRRTLVATGQATTATTEFLVVARSVKPSGTDVTQINRSRRYNNR